MPHSLAPWFRALRAYSFTASVTPILLGTVLALETAATIDLTLAAVALLGGVCLHAGTNLVNDYVDFRRGVDRLGRLGGSGVLTGGLLRPQDVAREAALAFAVAVLAGIFLYWHLGWPILVYGALGLAGGFFYTAGPIGYKYRALGEPLVFLLMGPLAVSGAHFVQVAAFEWSAVLVSLPVGFLVAAILFANNLRDLEDDTDSGYHTEASLMGLAAGRWAFAAMLASAYAILVGLVWAGAVPVAALAALVSLPLAWHVGRTIYHAPGKGQAHWVGVVEKTAAVHLAFGILFTGGILAGYCWG